MLFNGMRTYGSVGAASQNTRAAVVRREQYPSQLEKGKRRQSCGSWWNRTGEESSPWSSQSGRFWLCWTMSCVRLSLDCCPLAAPEWDGPWQRASSWVLLGLQGCLGRGLNCCRLESPELSACQFCSHENLRSWFVCFQSFPRAGTDSP